MGKRQMRPHTRKARACEWDSPRLLEIIDWLEGVPGQAIQLPIPEIVEATGIPISSLKRHLQWAAKYGIITIEHHYHFGAGRTPNLYELQIDRETWDRKGEGIVRRWQENAERQPVNLRVSAEEMERLTSSGPGTGWAAVR